MFLIQASISECNSENKEFNHRFLEGAKSVAAALKLWTHKKEVGEKWTF